MDSIFLPETASSRCGVSWQANSQTGDVGVKGRASLAFDVASTLPFATPGTGEICATGRTPYVGLLVHYLNLRIKSDDISLDKTVRVALGDYGVYKKGDLLIKVGTSYSWSNTAGTTLTPESSARPASPVQLAAVASAANFTNGSGTSSSMALIKLKIVDSYHVAAFVDLSANAGTVTVDLDLASPGVDVTDTSSDAKILTTFSASFLSNIGAGSMQAIVKVTR